MRSEGEIHNGVLCGKDGVLFLGLGAHGVIDLACGRTSIPFGNFDVFRQNVMTRASWCASHNASFIHVVFPDKQTISPESWPLDGPISIGQQYIDRETDLKQWLEWPVDLLRGMAGRAISKVDTHYSAAGQTMLAGRIAERITGASQRDLTERLMSGLTKRVLFTGDLGSKFDPPIAEDILEQSIFWPQKVFSNRLRGGNNGIIDIRVNLSAPQEQRILIIGDSFGRQLASILSYWFREVAFFRSGYFHPEIADAFCPSVLITGQAERYLDRVISDEDSPWFFSYPALNDGAYSSDPEFRTALTAELRYPGKLYQKFMQSL